MIAKLIRVAVIHAAISCTTLAGGPLDKLLVPLTGETEGTTESAIPTVRGAGRPETYTLEADALIAELEKELTAKLALNGELKLSFAQPWKGLKLPANHFAISVVEAPTSGIAGTFTIRAKILSDGTTVAEVPLSLRAQLWQEVWTAASRLDRGQVLDRSLLGTTKVDLLRERQPPLTSDVDPSTLEVAQSVTASRPLTRRDVIERPLVRKGQVVEVVAQHGQLAITMKALALQSGAGGDLIRLRNLESRKEFNGQILNENTIQVHF